MLARLFCVVILALMASRVAAGAVEVETYRGPVTVEYAPENVAVFDLAALDSLLALGVQPSGTVGKVFLPYLEDQLDDPVALGTIFEPDLEAVNAFAPDLVIAGGRSSQQVPQLERIAPTIDMTIWEDTIGQGLERLATFGQIFGKEAEAQALKENFEAKRVALSEAAQGQGRVLVVMTNGPKVSAYGVAGRFGWLYDVLGLPPAVDAVEQSTHGEAISFEFIRDANPDVLIVLDRLAAIGQPGAAAQVTLDNALVHETAAWKNDKVIFLDAGPIYIAGGGIQSLTLTLESLRAAFNGE